MQFWWTTIRELREQNAALSSNVDDLCEEVKVANQRAEMDRQLRVAAEALASDRKAAIEREVKRAEAAEAARSEAMKLVTQAKTPEIVPDIKQYTMAQVPTKKRNDPWFGPKFLETVKKIGTTEDPLKVPMPEEEVIQ